LLHSQTPKFHSNLERGQWYDLVYLGLSYEPQAPFGDSDVS